MCNVAELTRARRRIAELEKQLAPPVPPVLRAEISLQEMTRMLREKFPTCQVYISDWVKSLCDIEDINTFLAQDETNRQVYDYENYRCGDFAYRLMGQFSVPGWADIAKGILWTSGDSPHALLCCIDTNRDFWYIEPQNDSVTSDLEELDPDIKARVIMM